MTHALATIGHNGAPEPTPFEAAKTTVEDLYAEARQWLDGEQVSTKLQAEALNTLETRIRKAAKEAEELRKAEAKPFDDGKKEVQERFKPVLARTDEAIAAIKAALKPYLLELERQQKEAARIAHEQAEAARMAAAEALRQRDASNLESREQAEAAIAKAKEAEAAARKADGAKAHAKGEGRATGLRTVRRAIMADNREAAAWAWNERNAELMEWVQDMADKAVRAGAASIRGFTIIEEKTL